MSTAKNIPQEAVIVEPPYAMAARGLQFVYILKPPTQPEISRENHEDNISLFFRLRLEETDERQAEQENTKRRLVTCAIIHSGEGSERYDEIGLKKTSTSMKSIRQQRFYDFIGVLNAGDEMAQDPERPH